MVRKLLVVILSAALIVLLGAIFYSAFQPKPFSWHENYVKSSRQPYGAYILYNQLDNFFIDKEIRMAKEEDFYDYYFEEIFDYDSTDEVGNYIAVVDSNAFYTKVEDAPEFNFIAVDNYINMDNVLSKALLLHIYQGNHALVGSYNVNELFLKMIGVEIKDGLASVDEVDSTEFDILFYGKVKNKLRKNDILNSIEVFPEQAEILVQTEMDEVLAIKITIGDGSLTICTSPILFTNYYLLHDDNSIVESLLLALPDRDTYWSSYLVGRPDYSDKRSILDFIHSEPALKWAFYTLIVGVILFLLLQIRRKERPVPTIEPLKNLSLNFIESVSSLFFLHKNNKELIKKKMNYFLEFVRETYRLDTQNIDEKFIDRLSKKADVQPSLLNHIFKLYNEYLNKDVVSDDDFLRFNKLMQTFKKE